MCVGEEKGVLSKVELILPANVVEACYNLERNVHAYFMAVNQQDKTSSEITLYKLKDDSVKIRVTVLALGDEDEEEDDGIPAPPPGSRNNKRKRVSGVPEDEPSTSKRAVLETPTSTGRKGKGLKEESSEDEGEVEPSPGRLRTAKGSRKQSGANLEDFIPEEGELVAEGGEDEMTVNQSEAQSKSYEEGEMMLEDMVEVNEEGGPNTSASTVITVKKTIKSEDDKSTDRVRKVQMGRPWNWGKKTTLVYERKEKTFGKKGEEASVDDDDQAPRQTETLVIRNTAGKHISAQGLAESLGEPGRQGKTQVVKIVNPGADGDGADPDMPPIVLASEDGAIISADALELTDAMGGTVQVQVISQEGEDGKAGTQVLEIAPTIKSDGAMPSALKTPKMKAIKRSFDTPLSAPGKICTAKLKPVEEIPCQICDVYVGDYEQLLKHVKKHHMDVDGVDDYLEEVMMEMQVECPVCNIAVESQTALTVHIERQHSHIGTEIRCEPCNKTYKSAASLKNHIRQQHTARKRFECHVCSATFTETRSLREHINCVHETTETFDCDICGKTFLTKGRLRRHKYIHGGFRHFCEYCNKGFHLRDNMNKHVEIMHEQKYGKRFQCNYCGKAFTVKGNLQQHILGVHLKKSLYECPICNEGFKRKSMMLDHMKTHARTKVEPGTEEDPMESAQLVALQAKNAASTVDTENPIEGIPVAEPMDGDNHEGMPVATSEEGIPDTIEGIPVAREGAHDGETSGEEDYDYVEFD